MTTAKNSTKKTATKKPTRKATKKDPKVAEVAKLVEKGVNALGFDIFSIASDKKLELEGVWRDFIVNGKPVAKIKVARSGNSNYNARMIELYDQNRATISKGLEENATEAELERSNLVAERVTMQAFCETVFVGFEGFVDRNGDVLEDTLENRCLLYVNVSELVRQVANEALKAENYRLETLNTDAGLLGKL